ncbi:MAG: sigma-70 family RNA polymerase sigma factor [Pseudomonadota bacterium]
MAIKLDDPDEEGTSPNHGPEGHGSLSQGAGRPVNVLMNGRLDVDGAKSGGGGSAADQPDDETLIQAIAADRDKAAFATLFARYSGRIKALLIRSGATPDLAEDAAQEVMVTLWRRAETFDPAKAGAATWIFTIARNKRIDMIRRAKRPEPDADDPVLVPETAQSAETALAGADRDSRIREALNCLPEDQKSVIRLAFFHGCSHAEIAARLELPLGTVKSRLRLSFGRLRSELGGDFAEELQAT